MFIAFCFGSINIVKLFRYRNSSWRRAVVVLVEKQKVYVQYADYGQLQWVNWCDVLDLTMN